MRMPETMVVGGPVTKAVYIRADKVLEIIDTAQTYKMYPGEEDTYIDKMVIRKAILALKWGE